MTALKEATANQRRGADPEGSAFVMANAGSGKTRVLTERVARLLLRRVKPQQILCITFTKAAAAEMAERLFKMLGDWALLSDKDLAARLHELTGEDISQFESGNFAEVRRLFARALETPGGLKIQTIHSFCEGVLRRFPLEAGVPPGFTVIEETQANVLATNAIDALAVTVQAEPQLAADFSRLSLLRTEKDLRAALIKETRAGLIFGAILERYDTIDGVIRALAAELNIDPHQTAESIQSDFIDTLDTEALTHTRDVLAGGSTNPKKRAENITEFLSAKTRPKKWAALETLFLTTEGAARKELTTKPIQKEHPGVHDFLVEMQHVFLSSIEQLKALSIFHDTAAHYRIAAALRKLYTAEKAGNAALDFDDLIAHAARLLDSASAQWVRYKLDAGIDHILIDETQDTSPDQWRVIEALVDDYLSGSETRDGARTFFAVGDVKQSIYSFQGADAGVFEEKKQKFAKLLSSYHQATYGAYRDINMQMSFRTTAPVLGFVDALFVEAGAREGLGRDGVPDHLVARDSDAGLVELWPLTPKAKKIDANVWDLPVDTPSPDDPVRKLCDEVAKTIDEWLVKGEKLESKNRPIRASDILILVQSRGRLFDGVLGALARKNVAVAGADRLKLLEDPAVEDLLSYARFCVFSRDDLSLAEVLKSPLFNFDDDSDLFPLCFNRRKNCSLWRELNRRADEKEGWRDAADSISESRRIALREGPYAFLSHVLETKSNNRSGRARFNARLGEMSRDGIDEMLRQALEFEQHHPRSMRTFINWFSENAGEIKRETDRGLDAVRVMTVHGAKGLEGEVVFLIDAHRPPSTKDIGFPLELLGESDQAPRRGKLRVMTGAAKNDVEVTSASREARKVQIYDEYRRLLYVAATRARDRLYICGIESGNIKDPRGKAPSERTWHSLAADAFDRLGAKVEDARPAPWDGASEAIRRISSTQSAPAEDEPETTTLSIIETPEWMITPAPTETAKPRLSPSRLADEEEAKSAPQSSPALSPTQGDKYFRGRTLHKMLELLPAINPAERMKAADRLLGRLAPSLADAEKARWRDEVLTVLGDPAFAEVFGPGSKAEVAIGGEVNGQLVYGQIDRLVKTQSRVLIVDYKTNRPPPLRVEDTAPAYIAQMAAYRALLQEIYPDNEIECALLWTFEARLTALPQSLLDAAAERWLTNG